jgi:hypothetical protein
MFIFVIFVPCDFVVRLENKKRAEPRLRAYK